MSYEEAVEALKTVFGITGICPMVIEQTKDVEHLTDAAVRYVDSQYDRKHFTFKVNARRGDKEFPIILWTSTVWWEKNFWMHGRT